jgi:beta-xylosidase
MVNMLSFWTFSDVFEEGGPAPRPFEGAFGLRAKGGINKPRAQLADKSKHSDARQLLLEALPFTN